MRRCQNCKAELPPDKGGYDNEGRLICCVHCVFNPLGCRCQFGEYGVPQEPGPWMDIDDEDWEEEDE